MVKELLGFCSCKKCFRRGIHELNIEGANKNTGKLEKRKFKLCGTHAMEFIHHSGGEIQSARLI